MQTFKIQQKFYICEIVSYIFKGIALMIKYVYDSGYKICCLLIG